MCLWGGGGGGGYCSKVITFCKNFYFRSRKLRKIYLPTHGIVTPSPNIHSLQTKRENNESQITDFLFQKTESGNLMEARTNVTKKKNRILT